MARLRSRRLEPRRSAVATLDLLMGPTDAPWGYTVEELEILWEQRRDEIMAGRHGRHDGRRPWAWWAFEAREPQPWNLDTGWADETVRLAELGELTAAELAALHEAATEARLRIGTDSEKISGGWRQTPGAVSMDARDVELWERVEAALSNQARS
jgi:hypothetical protein